MQKMINVDDVTKQIIKEHSPYCFQLPGLPNEMPTVGGSGSRKSYQPGLTKFVYDLRINMKQNINY